MRAKFCNRVRMGAGFVDEPDRPTARGPRSIVSPIIKESIRFLKVEIYFLISPGTLPRHRFKFKCKDQ